MNVVPRRECGSCQLCCKLLPVPPLHKGAGERCRHQRFGKGCAVYHTAKMPLECALWNCRWLINDDAAELSRPDRAHYVIDLMPDYITLRQGDSGESQNIQVVQIWCDPQYRDAWRDPALRRWMLRRAQDGIATIIRYSTREALTVFPPPFADDGQWHEIDSGIVSGGHSFADIERALGGEAQLRIEE
jgi:hypothetical protein